MTMNKQKGNKTRYALVEKDIESNIKEVNSSYFKLLFTKFFYKGYKVIRYGESK